MSLTSNGTQRIVNESLSLFKLKGCSSLSSDCDTTWTFHLTFLIEIARKCHNSRSHSSNAIKKKKCILQMPRESNQHSLAILVLHKRSQIISSYT